MDPEQTAPIGAVWSGSTLFVIEASQTFQQMRKAAIGALRVKNSFFFKTKHQEEDILA